VLKEFVQDEEDALRVVKRGAEGKGIRPRRRGCVEGKYGFPFVTSRGAVKVREFVQDEGNASRITTGLHL
jgi:hypothetical protein